MKTAFYITLVLLIGSIFYIIHLSGIVTDQGIEITECSAELDSTRQELDAVLGVGNYDSVSVISNKDLNAYKASFEKIATGEFNSITGGVISKNAMLDVIRSTGANGAIAYQICADTVGSINRDAPNALFVAFSPVTMDFNTSDSKWTVNSVAGTKNYYSRHWCPPYCCRLED